MTTTAKFWYVYIVITSKGAFYTGVSTDPQRREHEHNNVASKASKYCWANRPVSLVWWSLPMRKSIAFMMEACFKKLSHDEKFELFAGINKFGMGGE